MAHPDVGGCCVIMAGGRGTRFWPLSRARLPKQLLSLVGDRSLLQATYDRVAPLVGPERVLVITNQDLEEATRAQLPELPASHVIGEPVGRNTAPCAALGVGVAQRLAPGEPVALLPADHAIDEGDLFADQLALAFARAAATDGVVTFGIPPTRPETGYGYLEVGAPTAGMPADVVPGVAFVEKPDRAVRRDLPGRWAPPLEQRHLRVVGGRLRPGGRGPHAGDRRLPRAGGGGPR